MKLVFKPFAVFSIHIGYKIIPGPDRLNRVQRDCDDGDEKLQKDEN
ncbi:hypothetical protein SAMN06265348_10559 [Pedobacter westerhofensis]|uniref:Uncharacterized protein n=1 Tax=Pedobacter westerhofensis TaxID=425512 RepID=A0A521D7H6_9SPHI|nr:hypothetical protein SAMN06265348_10559 [Pedobacter westerhofensis]